MPIDRANVINLLKRNHLFRDVDNTKLETVADYLVSLDVAAGESVFQQNDDSTFFYFVYSGQLKVSVYSSRTRGAIQIGFLEESDYFGQEVLADDWPRQVTVEATTDTTVLSLSVPNFKSILEVIPQLSSRLQLVLDIYRLMLSSRFAWLEPQEYVHYISRKHPYNLVLRLLAPMLFGVIAIPLVLALTAIIPLPTTMTFVLFATIAVALGWLVWVYIDWSNDYYLITNRRVISQEKVILLYESRQESPMEAVQSTTTSTSQIGRLLGYGNVAVRTFIGTIFFRAVSLPDQVMAIAQEHQLRAQTGQRRSETRIVEKLIEKSIWPVPQASAAPKAAPPKKPSNLRKFLSSMFHLRYEEGGAVIYRTHWFILLKKIFLPSLLLIGLIVLMTASILNVFTLLSPLTIFGLSFVVGMIVAGWWLYQYMDWHNDVYVISADQVIDVSKKPLGNEQRDAAPVKNILSIEYKRLGVIGLLLNYGTVYIRVGDKQLTFDDVHNPSVVQRELFDRVTAKNYAEKLAAQESERQRMAEYLAAYHRVTQRGRPPENPPARGGF